MLRIMQFLVDNILLKMHSLYTYVVLSHPYPLALGDNKSPAGFIFYQARSTHFGEKIEVL